MKIKTIWGLGGSVLLLSVQVTAIIGIALASYLLLYVVLNSKPHPQISYSSATSVNTIAEKQEIVNPFKAAAIAKEVPEHHALVAKSVTSNGHVTRLNGGLPLLAPPRGPFVSDPAGGTVNGVSYSHILGRGCYTLMGTLKGNVLVTGEAILYIPKNGLIKFDSQDVIRIAKGARLTVCNDSRANAVFGRFSNENNHASNFLYYGLAGATGSKAVFRVGAKFYGALYAPDQDLVFIGSQERHNDFYGSVTGNTVTLLTSKE